MHDGLVVASCITSRGAYDRVRPFVDESEFTPMAAFWWKLVAGYYDADASCSFVDRPVLRERGKRQANAKHVDTMLEWFDNLDPVGSPDNVVADLIAVKRHAKGNELAARIGEDSKKLRALAQEYVDLLGAESLEKETWVQAGDWDEIDEQLSESNRTTILPLALNKRCRGGATPGDHIVIFGPTEIGKSLFTINMVCGFLRQSKRVLYVSNEDAARKIKDRARCNLAHMSPEEVVNNRLEAIARAEGKGISNLIVGNMDPGDVSQIEAKAKEFESDIIVVDQLRNLNASTGRVAGITQRIDQAAQDFRSLLIRGQYIGVSILQAYAGEHGKPQVWFAADDVDSSRIGGPGAADLLIGIGADQDMLDTGARAISICKNKIGDRKDGFIAQFDTARSKCR